jgi:D-alanine-D-alanine ligase-like ATP-grasp enzyme
MRFLLQFVQNKPHIVQQGIRVVQHQGCNTDIRLLLVKDRTGTWREIFTRVRMTKGSFPIINSVLAQKVFAYEDFYSDRSAAEGKGLPSSSEIVRQAIRIACAIDRRIGTFGELGIDMAVDRQGKIWLIEANSKPNKCPKPYHTYSKPILPQFLSVFEFAKCLERVNVNE